MSNLYNAPDGSLSGLSKRDKILAEATRQFNGQGYHDTRLEDIADTFGISKTNVSYHFRSKEGLLASAYNSSCDFSEAKLKLAAEENNGLERAIAFLRSHLHAHSLAISGSRPSLAVLNDLAGLNEPDFDVIQKRYRRHIQTFRTFLSDGLTDGSINIQSIDASTFFAFNVMHWIPNWLEVVPEKRHEEAINGFCDLIKYGLSRSSTSPNAPPISRNTAADLPAIFDRETRNKLKREAILRTGIRYLNRSGYRNLSLDAIAKELGVTRGAFYYQIADKETFLVESFNRTFSLVEEALELASEHSNGNALYELERAVRWLFEGHLTEFDPLLRLNLVHLLDKPSHAVVSARLRRIRAKYAELMARGMVDGSMRLIDIDAAEHILFGAIFSASGRRFSATPLVETWYAQDEPVTASAAYFEPLITGFAAQ